MSKATLLKNGKPPLRRRAEAEEPGSLWEQHEQKLDTLLRKDSGPITSTEELREVKRYSELRRGQGNLTPFSYPIHLA